MYKTGQILRYLGESLVFSKNKEYTVETSNEKFFIVQGHPYPHSSPFWEPSLKVGDWMWTNFRRSIQRVTHPSQEGEKVDVDSHPHRDVIRAHEQGEVVQLLAYDGTWQDTRYPGLYLSDEYRVKPNCFKVGDWVWYRDVPHLVTKVQDSNLIFKGKSIVCSARECTLVVIHKHLDTMQEWANGAHIEARRYPDQPWLPVRTPSWFAAKEYRVVPEPETKRFQVYYKSKPYNIEVTFTDDKITKLTAL
jgi:hypothetical protein